MPTSSDLVKQKREREAWDAYMAGLRAQTPAPVQRTSAPVEEKPGPILGPDGQPITPEPTDG